MRSRGPALRARRFICPHGATGGRRRKRRRRASYGAARRAGVARDLGLERRRATRTSSRRGGAPRGARAGARRRDRRRSRAGTSRPRGPLRPTVGRTPTLVTPRASGERRALGVTARRAPRTRRAAGGSSGRAAGSPSESRLSGRARRRAPRLPTARAAGRGRVCTSSRSPGDDGLAGARARVAAARVAGDRVHEDVEPELRAESRSSVRSPARFAPNRKFSPTTTTRAQQRPRDELAREAAPGGQAANAVSNGARTCASTPSSPRSSARRSIVVRSCGAPPPTTSAGCGSNVSTSAERPPTRARSTASRSTAWCPRCTPSKLPMTRTLGTAIERRGGVASWTRDVRRSSRREK